MSIIMQIPLKPQPTWPDGEAPDSIHSIQGGFRDGSGVWHAAPRGVTSAAPRAGDKTWCWEEDLGAGMFNRI